MWPRVAVFLITVVSVVGINWLASTEFDGLGVALIFVLSLLIIAGTATTTLTPRTRPDTNESKGPRDS